MKLWKVQWKYYKHDIKNYLYNHNYRWKFKLSVCLLIFIVLLYLDFITKQLALYLLSFNYNKYMILSKPTIKFLTGFINFSLVFNNGMAFGVNSNNLLLTMTMIIITILCLLLLFIFFNNTNIIISLILIITGGCGNLFDRIWNSGWVIDFLTWELFPPYSVFNFSDIYIILGAIMIIVYFLIDIIKYFIRYKNKIYKKEKY